MIRYEENLISPHEEQKHQKKKRPNLVYGLTIVKGDCNATYVRKQSLNARLKQHKKPNINQAQNSAVIMDTVPPIGIEIVFILDNKEHWHRKWGRGLIKKAI